MNTESVAYSYCLVADFEKFFFFRRQTIRTKWRDALSLPLKREIVFLVPALISCMYGPCVSQYQPISAEAAWRWEGSGRSIQLFSKACAADRIFHGFFQCTFSTMSQSMETFIGWNYNVRGCFCKKTLISSVIPLPSLLPKACESTH